jgi:crotonobetainyl-CoA:carnitine CoA-transferase CaiB-like acyl-CoA transferase
MLAYLGADVVKVEGQDHPDWYRGWEQAQGGDPPEIEIRARFNSLNRDKRGVTLDLQSPEGVAAALELISVADVVIENFASGVLERLGLGTERLHSANPGLVSLSMTAFGEVGPLAGTRAYGSTMEQASGLPFVNGETTWPPAQQHVAFGDPVAGVFAVAGVVAALFNRRTGGGCHVDMAQVECLFQVAADAILADQILPGGVERRGNSRPALTHRQCVVLPSAGEDSWVVAAGQTSDWERVLAEVLDERSPERLPSAAPDGSPPDAATILSGPDLVSRLCSRGLAAAEVMRPEALIADPQLVATGVWHRMDRRYVGEHTVAAPAFRIDGVRPAPRRPAPTLGEHSDILIGGGWPEDAG